MQQDKILERLLVAALAFATGLGLGFLLAPQAGPTTRRTLVEGVRGGVRWAEDQARGAVAPVAEHVREASQSLAGRVVPQMDDWDVIDGPDLVRDLPGLPRRG